MQLSDLGAKSVTTPMNPNRDSEFDFAPLGVHNPKTEKSIDISKFLLTIWKPLIVGGCLGGLAGILVYLMLGPVYSASTRVLVSKKASVPINDGEANRFGDRGDHVELMKTDLIVERAYALHGLGEIPELATAYDPIKEVSEGLAVSRSSGQESSFDNIVDIEYLHPDKKIAKVVVQAMVESYRDYLNDTRDENSKQIHKVLIEKLAAITKEIGDKEKEYQKFRREAPVFLKASPVVTVNGVPTPGQSRYEAELSSIEKAQTDNLRRRAGIQAKLATLDRMMAGETSREVLEFWVLHSLSTGTSGESKGGGGSSALAGPPAKAALDQQLLTARMLEQNLLNTLGTQHVAVRNVRKQIDTILDFYARQGLTPPVRGNSNVSPLSNRSQRLGMDLVAVYRQTMLEQIEEIAQDDKQLALLHTDAETKAKRSELFEIDDQNRKDEIAVKKKQQQQIFDQIAAYDVSKEQEGYRLKQIAQVRVQRSLKRVIKIVGVFGVMGAAIVFVLAYFREWIDNSLRSLEEVRQLTGNTVLGAVPGFSSSLDADRLAKNSQISPAVCYYHRPGSREAESFRSVRTTLYHSMGSNDQILQISSAEPGDGKSTTAANMAVAIAQSGKSILLIDCDLRRPTQHSLFGLSQEIGLTDVLLHEIDWINAVRSTPVDHLSVMTAGLCPDNPAELLSTSALSHTLRQARNNYDVILLDSPPVLAVSDPSIVAPHADGMLLVVRMNKNTRPTLLRTQETLNAHGVKLYGIVANDFTATNASEEGYNYEEYSGYYSTSKKMDSPIPIPSREELPPPVTS